MPYLIRAEGVNLSAVLNDTSDLSTIRGGGLMLLEAASVLGAEEGSKPTTPTLRIATDCKAKSTGASAALLWCGDKTAKDSITEIRQRLQEDHNRHFTFVVNAVKYDNRDFRQAEASVLAANRWQQMQSPSLAVPAAQTNPVCEVDGVRPSARQEDFPGGEKPWCSESVIARREQGRDLRQKLYKNEITKLLKKNSVGDLKGTKAEFVAGMTFTDDLHALAGDYKDAGNLNDKFAVLYMDGNNFGKVARECDTDIKLKQWDDKIKELRRTLLLEILQAANKDDRWHNTEKESGKKPIRLETLLWGGDELIFVVPAWLGWPLLDFIFERTQNWKYGGKDLTHGVGLVFCHVKAPIQRITELAKKLGEEAKKASERKQNAVCWLALESFDHVGADFDDFMSRRYHKTIKAEHWVLSADNVKAINANLKQLKDSDSLPRSQIVQAALSSVRLAAANNDETTIKTLKNAYAQVKASAEGTELLNLWNALKGVIGKGETAFPDKFPETADERLQHVAAWAQLAELWDYAGLSPLAAAQPQGEKK